MSLLLNNVNHAMNNLHNTVIFEAGFAGLRQEHLDAAHDEAIKQNIPVHMSLVRLGLLTERDLLLAAADKWNYEYIEQFPSDTDPEALKLVSANIASHYNIIPISFSTNRLLIATADPFDSELKKELGLILNHTGDIEFVIAASDTIEKAIRKHYGLGAATVEQMVCDGGVRQSQDTSDLDVKESQVREASVLKLVNQLLTDAIKAGATDIHIEPYEHDLKVRYRIDGILLDAGVPSSVRLFRDGITSRIKVMSGLDIAEKRLPQDGRTHIDLGAQKFDLRVSVLPTRHGEATNIRILPQSTLISDLETLGMAKQDAGHLRQLIHKPHGIMLVTGPTGSGKTTTLYTCMNLLKDTDRKILTIEDPVEYDMPGIVQMQVNANIGFTFARALRSMLRHDPDIMLVGEIRDLETAETAIRTALTGHLVFSTLHTNDAASTLMRLLEMGIEPYLAASSIEAVLAQRLVRVICPLCKEPHVPETEIATAIKSLAKMKSMPRVYHGRGCSKCRFTGYQGRTVITELLVLSDTIRSMTIARKHANEIDNQARQEGMISLMERGLEKAHCGITTYEEVLRVTKGTVIME